MKLGWLDPGGNFYEVGWGNHASWAVTYTMKNYPYSEYKDLYNGSKGKMYGGDFLVYVLGWILIDSPNKKDIHITRGKSLTKAQQKWLYDYYIENSLYDKANALYE